MNYRLRKFEMTGRTVAGSSRKSGSGDANLLSRVYSGLTQFRKFTHPGARFCWENKSICWGVQKHYHNRMLENLKLGL